MTTDLVDPGATAQQRLAHVARTWLHPRLKGEGFARSGHTWRRGDAEQGWVFVQLEGNRRNTTDRVEVTFNTVVWPAGTWEVRCAVLGGDAASRPFAAVNAPLFALPRVIDPSVGTEQFEWHLDADTDLDQLGEQLADFAVAAAAWGNRLLDPTAAVERLTARGRVWDLIHAVAVLRRAVRLDEATRVLEDLTQRWTADPRPTTLGPHLQAWRREHGLPADPGRSG